LNRAQILFETCLPTEPADGHDAFIGAIERELDICLPSHSNQVS
jgi:hypothetical protein